MKNLAYYLFAIIYYIARMFPVKHNKVVMIMTHDASEEGNCMVVKHALDQRGNYSYVTLTREQEHIARGHIISTLMTLFIKMPYHLATCEIVLLDNVFLPMAYLNMRKGTKVVQLWHGTGTIKKFGQFSNTGKLKVLEKKANKCITHLIVGNEETKKLYAQCFGIDEKNVFVTGLPRTDLLFSEEEKEANRRKFYEEFEMLKGKRIVLYAPTFRDEQIENPEIALDLKQLSNHLSEDEVFVLRLHPHIAKRNTTKCEYNNIIDLSFYSNLNTLLDVSSIVISDYSSIIFEAAALEKPIIFYAYDYSEFMNNGRGCFYDYEKFVPGPVVKNQEELEAILKTKSFDLELIRKFKDSQFVFQDGRSTERIVTLVGGNRNEK